MPAGLPTPATRLAALAAFLDIEPPLAPADAAGVRCLGGGGSCVPPPSSNPSMSSSAPPMPTSPTVATDAGRGAAGVRFSAGVCWASPFSLPGNLMEIFCARTHARLLSGVAGGLVGWW